MKTPAQKLLIGAHTSAQGGVHHALLEGASLGATTIQLFTSNQKQWKSKPISDEECALFKETQARTGISSVMSHDSYLINLGCPNSENLHKSRKAFKEELERCHQLELTYLNFHPGAALDSPLETCLDLIVESLKEIESLAAQGPTRLLIEATAGQGSTVGHRFEHLSYLIERVKDHIPIGICIDTCHIFAAGYDIRTALGWNQTMEEFEKVVGLKHLHALHINDSTQPLGSRKDRHANLGKGEIGIECFKTIMQDDRLRHIPKYLETPEGLTLWKEEIALLRTFAT